MSRPNSKKHSGNKIEIKIELTYAFSNRIPVWESGRSVKIKPQTLGADKGYATGEFVYHVFKEEVTPHIPIMNTRSKNDKGIFPITKFSFDAERNEYICPQGKGQTPWGSGLDF